jgi:plasmid stabilization system protein ParE
VLYFPPFHINSPGEVIETAHNAQREETRMARGDKGKYTDKQKRQAEHIEEGYEKRGVSEDEAEKRAWATVNAMHGGGEKPGGSGYGKPVNKEPARKGGRKGGKKAGKKAAKKSAKKSGAQKGSSKKSSSKSSKKGGAGKGGARKGSSKKSGSRK